MNHIYNFSAGPSMLPLEVMNKAKKDFKNWCNLGSSVLEISHRSQEFLSLVKNSKQDLRDLLNIPLNYEILFFQGGARGQFSAIPMNFTTKNDQVDYIYSGYWSMEAAKEAKKYCKTKIINVISEFNKKKSIIPYKKWKINSKSNYIHYCPNETIEGISIYEEPVFKNKILIGDFSSTLLSRKINIKKYSLIYASAQKNIGASGITIVIIKKKIIRSPKNFVPSILSYKNILENDSLFNTPVNFSWYLSSLIFKWIKKVGGIKKIEKINVEKANLLYKTIDKSKFYNNYIHKKNRSNMNVVFQLKNKKLNDIFVKEAKLKNLYALNNHKILGGIRASIYNAMPIQGIKKLIKFMIYFEKKYYKIS
ncbi:MAG: 3-phosphoserine/phosphohydroxythreonine transaminase [Buchnera aphidicola (Periphyllus lyropictus)]|uniref:3-phosphoserine/phosphohydroxythreonine transaminase n=1 Tax=Buchnera aphidicola TaxID=9 RepID=UPI001ED6A239|nr:3-phosphoserine/phosphohydroxythreonine transaminase [Buchnera aphidicola]NIH16822.1 3-phosphoserine/phosphohydroxythreonine transaminase [Buchnera aphidicola (Periphyllus lyropictus)]USS94504.1 3-phosphoserine/phosphohydroxythreonine transaminase [Buchnera aphidicola (Periphyllus lyropictus)]